MHLVGYFTLAEYFKKVFLLLFCICDLLCFGLQLGFEVNVVLVIRKIVQEVLIFESRPLLLHLQSDFDLL